MSRRGRSLLKVIGVLYLVALGALLYSIQYGRARRTRPELRPVKLVIPNPKQEDFNELKQEIVEAGYRARAAPGLEAGAAIGAEEIEKLVEASPGEVLVWDMSVIRDFAAQDLVSAEELRDADRDIIARVGDTLDEERLFRMALACDERTGEKHHGTILVKGTSSIVGFDLTLVFTALNFLALVALLYALLWEPLTRLLDERARAVREDIETARGERDEAESLKSAAEKQLADIRGDARKMVEEGRAEGEKERARLTQEGREEAKRLAERAERGMRAEAEDTRERLVSEIAGLSAELAEKMLEREVTAADHERLTSKFVRSLEADAEQGDGGAR